MSHQIETSEVWTERGPNRSAVDIFAHDRANVLGVRVSALCLERAVELADRWLREESGAGYVCLTGVHGVMEAQSDPGFLRILNEAVINAPDGMPMSWVGRWQGYDRMDRVFGPDFMAEMCRVSVDRGYRHFLYGGEAGVADQLGAVLQRRFPGISIAGTYTPPFRELDEAEEKDLIARLKVSRPHVLWVGLGTPKQERFMARYVRRLGVPMLVGVGAAFDYHTGRVRDCPAWMKRSGMQWFHRLCQDPGRLWRRYLKNNPSFLWQITWQILGFQRRSESNG